jgi:hypothetical protein
MGLAGVAETVWEVLVQWGRLTRWLRSRLACDDPGGIEFELQVDPDLKSVTWLQSKISQNFSTSVPVTTSGSVTSPISEFGVMVRYHWKDPAPSATQTQEPKTKVSPRLRAAVGLMMMEAVEFAVRSLVRSPT